MSMSMYDFIGGSDLYFCFWCIVLLSYFLAINHCNHSATHWWKEKNTKCDKDCSVDSRNQRGGKRLNSQASREQIHFYSKLVSNFGLYG